MIVLRVVAKDIGRHFLTRWNEWGNAFAMLIIGVQFWRPETLFDLPSYRILSQLGSENSWGTVLIVIGGIRLAALAINGTFAAFHLHLFTPLVRASLAFTGAGVSFALAAGYWLGLPGGVGFVLAAALMWSDIGLCLNIAREAGAADQRFRTNGIRG
jgi:hypothetical protein